MMLLPIQISCLTLPPRCPYYIHHRVSSHQVIATLTFPNIALTIPVWYLAPRAAQASIDYIAIGVVAIPPNDNTKPHILYTQVAPMPQEVSIPKPNEEKPKDNKKGKKEKAPNAPSSSVPQPYALCETIGYPTNKCPKLKELKALLHAPKEPVNPPTHI